MSIKENIILHIRDCNTSNETLDVLKSLYETTNTNRVLSFKTKILSMKVEANGHISNFISHMSEI